MTTWTKIAKPTGTSWINVTKSIASNKEAPAIGLLIAITQEFDTAGTLWNKIVKPSGTIWTKITKSI